MFTSCVKLEAMLRISEEFGILCDLKFNVVKSCAGCVGRSRPDIGVQFLLENRVLPWVNKLKYLSIVFNTMRGLQVDCSERIQKFFATVSSVLGSKLPGFKFIFADILVKKCLPIFFYGMDCCILIVFC